MLELKAMNFIEFIPLASAGHVHFPKNTITFQRALPEEPVFSIGCNLRFFNFFSKVLPDTNCSRKEIWKIFRP